MLTFPWVPSASSVQRVSPICSGLRLRRLRLLCPLDAQSSHTRPGRFSSAVQFYPKIRIELVSGLRVIGVGEQNGGKDKWLLNVAWENNIQTACMLMLSDHLRCLDKKGVDSIWITQHHNQRERQKMLLRYAHLVCYPSEPLGGANVLQWMPCDTSWGNWKCGPGPHTDKNR